jgi:hypothetical protein
VCEAGAALEHTGCIRMHACKSVCVRLGVAVEQMQVSLNTALCLRSNVQGAFEHIVQSKKYIYIYKKKKGIYKHNTQTKIFMYMFTQRTYLQTHIHSTPKLKTVTLPTMSPN